MAELGECLPSVDLIPGFHSKAVGLKPVVPGTGEVERSDVQGQPLLRARLRPAWALGTNKQKLKKRKLVNAEAIFHVHNLNDGPSSLPDRPFKKSEHILISDLNLGVN